MFYTVALVLSARPPTPIGAPAFAYLTYFEGEDFEVDSLLAADDADNVILAEGRNPETLPGTDGTIQPRQATGVSGHRDILIDESGPTSLRLLWSTYFGGASNELPSSLAADHFGVASPTSVPLGGSRAGEVLYSGAAPRLVFGVAQSNVLIGTDAPLRTAIGVGVRIGGIFSPAGTTVAVP